MDKRKGIILSKKGNFFIYLPTYSMHMHCISGIGSHVYKHITPTCIVYVSILRWMAIASGTVHGSLCHSLSISKTTVEGRNLAPLKAT